MSDTPTDIPGAAIRRIRNRDYVVVHINRMFPATQPTIAVLAQRMRLQPEDAFDALLRYRSNGHVVRQLYRDRVQGIDDTFPGMGAARRRLRREGERLLLSGHRSTYGIAPNYLSWRVDPPGGRPVLLTLSQGFKEVMRQATQSRKRETRVSELRPAFQALEAQVREIRIQALQLSDSVGSCDTLAEGHAREIAILETLNGLLGVLLEYPKSPPVDPGDRQDVEQLRERLRTLKNEAHQHMILDPPDAFRAGLVRERNQRAAALRRQVEDAVFVGNVQLLADNSDIASPQLWSDTHDALRMAVNAMLLTPEADAVLENHVRPLIQRLAGREFDLEGLAAPRHPAFEQAVRRIPAPPPESVIDSALVILAGLAGLTPQVVGNVPGPSSLAVCVIEIAAPQFLAPIAQNVMEGNRQGGLLYRALVNAAGLNRVQRIELLDAIDRGELNRMRDINWSNRFMNSPAWGAAMGLASAICFFVSIQSDDANTLRRWSNILGSATGTASGVAVVVARYSDLVRDRIVQGIGGKVLGVVGGVCVMISGAATAIEEYDTGDDAGMLIAIAGATGGALSVAGFLVASGAGTAGTGVGAPIGVVMMAVGVVLAIGIGVVSLVRSISTAGSHVIFEAFINHFGRDGGPYDVAAQQRPTLRAAFEAVQSSHHGVDFWDADAAKIP